MLQNHSLCCTTSAAPAQRPAKKQARANARACFDRVSLIPVPVPCAPVCNPVYKIAFPVLFPAYSFLSPRRVGAFAGPSRLCSCVAGRKVRKNRRCFVLSLGVILYTGSFFGTDAAACPCCRLWTARRNCATPSLYTARPICRLTFPLGSDTISIKHRKGRPAPWPSS